MLFYEDSIFLALSLYQPSKTNPNLPSQNGKLFFLWGERKMGLDAWREGALQYIKTQKS